MPSSEKNALARVKSDSSAHVAAARVSNQQSSNDIDASRRRIEESFRVLATPSTACSAGTVAPNLLKGRFCDSRVARGMPNTEEQAVERTGVCDVNIAEHRKRIDAILARARVVLKLPIYPHDHGQGR